MNLLIIPKDISDAETTTEHHPSIAQSKSSSVCIKFLQALPGVFAVLPVDQSEIRARQFLPYGHWYRSAQKQRDPPDGVILRRVASSEAQAFGPGQ